MAGEPPIQERMYNAILAGDVAGFERMLRENPEHTHYPDGRSMWLSDAATAGALPIVQLLVRLGVDVNEPANNDSVPSPEGVVYRAASEGHLDIVRWLLDQGAAVNHEVGGRTRCYALTLAARDGHLDVVRLLVERGAAVNACWAGDDSAGSRAGFRRGGGRRIPPVSRGEDGRGAAAIGAPPKELPLGSGAGLLP